MFLIGGVCSTALMAQRDSIPDWSTLSDAYLDKNWLTSHNPAGLGAWKQGVKSDIQLSGRGGFGGLKNYFSSTSETTFGAEASSLARLSESVVVVGRVGYLSKTSKDLAGSYFIDPTHTPFDLIEYTDDNAGDKHLEELYLEGGVGVDLARWLAVGASLDYKASSYAKRKDLRHINSLMDLSLRLGGVFHIGEHFDIGANYHYRRRNETLLLSTYGTQDKTFVSLLSYGGFFGKQEVFGEIGYTKENETKPLFEQYHGADVQVVWRKGRWEWFNEASFSMRSGYYGDPSHSTVVYANHDGNELSYRTGLTLSQGGNAHTLGMTFGRGHVENRENIYVFRNEESGRDYIEYLGERETGERTLSKLLLDYTARLGIHEGLPRWVTSFEASFNNRNTRASNYPDYRRQDISWWRTRAEGTRNFLSKGNCWMLSLRVLYGGGTGAAYNDGRYGTSTDDSALTRTRNDLLMQEWEYLTSTQLGGGLGLGFSRLFLKNKVQGYARVEYDVCKALNTRYLADGGMRHNVAITLGCTF